MNESPSAARRTAVKREFVRITAISPPFFCTLFDAVEIAETVGHGSFREPPKEYIMGGVCLTQSLRRFIACKGGIM